jgi:hypothetical protein
MMPLRPEQHWSLMPLHAVCSMVRPASFLFGAGGGYGTQNPMTFPQYVSPWFAIYIIYVMPVGG